VDPSSRPAAASAGAALIVLGAAWFAIGAVLVVLAVIYGGGPGSLPAELDIDPNVFAAAPRSAIFGAFGVLAGAGQILTGHALARRTTGWAGPAALGSGVLGALLLAFWLVTGIGAGRPAVILVLPLLAYAFVAWAALRGGAVRA
jgi:hypothetical protein